MLLVQLLTGTVGFGNTKSESAPPPPPPPLSCFPTQTTARPGQPLTCFRIYSSLKQTRRITLSTLFCCFLFPLINELGAFFPHRYIEGNLWGARGDFLCIKSCSCNFNGRTAARGSEVHAPSISASLHHTGRSPSEPSLLAAPLLIAESTGRGSPESPPLDQQVAQGVVVAPGSPEAEASAQSSGPASPTPGSFRTSAGWQVPSSSSPREQGTGRWPEFGGRTRR